MITNTNSFVHMFAIVMLLPVIVNAAVTPTSSQAAPSPQTQSHCSIEQIGKVFEKNLKTQSNIGEVKSWEQEGTLWSIPHNQSPEAIRKILETEIKPHCDVLIAEVGGFTARIAEKDKPILKTANQERSDGIKEAVSTNGVTLGFMKLAKGEHLLLMYPARIAAAMSRGAGRLEDKSRVSTLKVFTPQIDAHFKFGAIRVNIFGGQAKASMRDALDAIFRDLRHEGYVPTKDSEPNVSKLDSLVIPDTHESYWMKSNGFLRVELKRKKGGLVEANLHEDLAN
jgi:hypothetical protein